jgi:hypothetical protein
MIAVVALLGACARSTVGGDIREIPYPTGAQQIVLRVATSGGLLPPDARAGELPSFSLFGDGRLVTLGPQIEIYPPPALPPLLQQTLSPEGIRTLLAEAKKAGLFADRNDTALSATIMDAGTTTFTVAAAGETYTTSVYALGLDPGPVPGDAEAGARAKIQAFNEKLFDLSWLPKGSVTPAIDYDPQAMRVYVFSYENESPELKQRPVPWPLDSLRSFGAHSGDVPGARCGVIQGPGLTEILTAASRANALTPWVSGGHRYRLVFRPLLPDESGC